MHTMQELWRRFEEWLRQNAPGDYSTLRAGASDIDISRLESGVGFPLHGELKSLLSEHNGVTPRRSSMEPGAFLLGYSLLDTGRILEWHQNLSVMAHEALEEGYEEEVVGRTAHAQWVPFAQALTGDLLFVDHRTGHYGEVGEISFGDPEFLPLWPSMTLMLTDLCNAVEESQPLPTARRRPSVHEGRMLEWVTD
ncbi:SMI1/KNR4 family protein [Streptomyces violarus]|uniref:Cell wall assembly regulator SMI1 n=1 Tax=Streptomyces violarus TaxID=67380 RepID=A0A7W5EZE8_9ACTN|nr:MULTISPECIES: SMI1/KNR4 family protein [Streptomyces]MBB3074387.1 cell wall assembly regulator SMI1 [Streptomyces violarus]WRT97086.1 SMI1/KNR4 family protein [Streptomyces sp. CGMCC 4.1772]